MPAAADDPFARFLCQVETWRRNESRWKKLCGAAVLFALVMLIGTGIQFAAVCQALGRVEEATAELAAFRKELQEERLKAAVYMMPTRFSGRVNLSSIWIDLDQPMQNPEGPKEDPQTKDPMKQ